MARDLFGAEVPPSQSLVPPLERSFDGVAPPWRALCAEFLGQEVGRRLCARVDERVRQGVPVFPPRPLRVLESLAPYQVRVVILGQDPYHGPGEAEGLAFSVPNGVRIPPSLRNIRQELSADVGGELPVSGSLAGWLSQGVLLLNTCLTVEQDCPASHAGWGWEDLTDRIIKAVAQDPAPKAFMLWGAHAQKKSPLIEGAGPDHLLLRSNHPSPLSARRSPAPFLGSRPFSAANAHLARCGRQVVDWNAMS